MRSSKQGGIGIAESVVGSGWTRQRSTGRAGRRAGMQVAADRISPSSEHLASASARCSHQQCCTARIWTSSAAAHATAMPAQCECCRRSQPARSASQRAIEIIRAPARLPAIHRICCAPCWRGAADPRPAIRAGLELATGGRASTAAMRPPSSSRRIHSACALHRRRSVRILLEYVWLLCLTVDLVLLCQDVLEILLGHGGLVRVQNIDHLQTQQQRRQQRAAVAHTEWTPVHQHHACAWQEQQAPSPSPRPPASSPTVCRHSSMGRIASQPPPLHSSSLLRVPSDRRRTICLRLSSRLVSTLRVRMVTDMSAMEVSDLYVNCGSCNGDEGGGGPDQRRPPARQPPGKDSDMDGH